MLKKQGGYLGKNSGKKDSLQLFGSRLDEFYELMANEMFEYESNDIFEKRKASLSCKKNNPIININIRKNNISTHTVFHGISVECDLPQIYEGSRNGYYIDEKHLCRISDKFYQDIKILKEYRDKGETNFEVGRHFLADFYRTVLPKFREIAEVTETNCDDIEQYLAPEVQFAFYLDVEDGDMLCKAMAEYGDRECNILTIYENAETEAFREANKEISNTGRKTKKHLSDEIITGEANTLSSMSKDDFLDLLEILKKYLPKY